MSIRKILCFLFTFLLTFLTSQQGVYVSRVGMLMGPWEFWSTLNRFNSVGIFQGAKRTLQALMSVT